MKMNDLFQQITYKKMFGEYGQLLIFRAFRAFRGLWLFHA